MRRPCDTAMHDPHTGLITNPRGSSIRPPTPSLYQSWYRHKLETIQNCPANGPRVQGPRDTPQPPQAPILRGYTRQALVNLIHITSICVFLLFVLSWRRIGETVVHQIRSSQIHGPKCNPALHAPGAATCRPNIPQPAGCLLQIWLPTKRVPGAACYQGRCMQARHTATCRLCLYSYSR